MLLAQQGSLRDLNSATLAKSTRNVWFDFVSHATFIIQSLWAAGEDGQAKKHPSKADEDLVLQRSDSCHRLTESQKSNPHSKLLCPGDLS